MANLPYENFFLSNEIEDQFNSHLDLVKFCTVDNNLTGTAGMDRIVHVYSASNGTQDLAQGEGNDKEINASFIEKKYTIKLAQNRFGYYDEEAMKDPEIVLVGTRHMGTDMFNHEMADIYGEFEKATMVVPAAALGFDCFADAQSMFNSEDVANLETFAFVNREDVAALRKALGTSLQYVQAFQTTGYIGSVAGTNVYEKKDVPAGEIIVATKGAVTLFNKKGTELETARDENTRHNYDYSRKYYVAALTDETKAVKIAIGVTATKTTDSEVDAGKTYYVAAGLGFVKVANPVTSDIGNYYEIA